MKKLLNMEKQAGKKNKDVPLEKDYAHYPPAPIEQVKPHAHKTVEKDEAPEQVIVQQPVKTPVSGEQEKTLNGSNKIVNSVDESYSDGSGGGFEATEQVNE